MRKFPLPDGVSEMKVKDYFLTKETFSLIRNQQYGYLETFPQPLENLEKYYQSDSYISHTDSKKNLFEKTYQFFKYFNIRYKFSLLNSPKKGSKILDYGCGTGDFLQYAKQKKLSILGVEPNETARKIAQQKLGETYVVDQIISEINEQFDYITLWHVLEHIPDLEHFIPSLKNKLKDDGTLLIAVPNFKSFDAKYYKKYWAAYDVPRHLWHFDPQSIQSLFKEFDMRIEKTYPLWFDSFYVSILSEKFRKNKFGIISAFCIALISNFIGTLNGNTSSIVYQIKKNSI